MIRALLRASLAGVLVSIGGFALMGITGALVLVPALPLAAMLVPGDPFPDGTGFAFALVLSLWLGVLVPPAWLAARALFRGGALRALAFAVLFPAMCVALAVGQIVARL